MAKLLKVLSIDGGGVRGLIPAILLARLEEDAGHVPISTLFDLIVGTSSGGLLTLFLTAPGANGSAKFTARQSVDILRQRMQEVFKSRYHKIFRALSGEHFYPNDNFESVLHDDLLSLDKQEILLQDALKPILIASYDMAARKPRFFKSYRTGDGGLKMWQVARATASAPMYFEPYQMPDSSEILIDAGLVANNPALCAYAEAIKMQKRHEEFVDIETNYDDILLVSLGTGYNAQPYTFHDVREWIIPRWLIPLLKVALDGGGASIHYQLKHILGAERYFRYQLQLGEENDDLDNADIENITKLEHLADTVYHDYHNQWQEMLALLNHSDEQIES
jgi:patatin-like phospholipase/acyl hydrolase